MPELDAPISLETHLAVTQAYEVERHNLLLKAERLTAAIARHKRRVVIDPQPWDRDLWAVLDA